MAFAIAASVAMADMGAWKAPTWQSFITESGAAAKILEEVKGKREEVKEKSVVFTRDITGGQASRMQD